LQPHYLLQKSRGFGRGKAQICGAYFGQVATGAQLGKGQLRVFARRYDQM
jgi:hypothetical protein